VILDAGHFFFRHRNALFPCAVVLAFAPGPLVFADPLDAAGLGVLLALAGQALRAATIGLDYIVRGGQNGCVHADELVTGGLFAHCRNPLYVANLIIITGVAFASDSAVALVLAPVLFAFAYYCIVRAEEDFLARRFGEAYRRYCEATPRFAVRLAGLAATLRGSRFHWRRLVVKEYSTPFAWILGISILASVNLVRLHGFEQSTARLSAIAAVVVSYFAIGMVARTLKKKRLLVGD
jgi:protein-S-isoprenylcysteine O-methyltransferase Ste14